MNYITKYKLIYTIFKCPKKTIIPINDIDAWHHLPDHQWVYNKIKICQTQNIDCAPIGIIPKNYPICLKPIINLYGMGWGSRIIYNKNEYKQYSQPGLFWMPFLKGNHLSYDFFIINGNIKWFVCFQGYTKDKGMFDYWETLPNKQISKYLENWINKHLNNKPYTGCINIETIDDKIIDCHLRMGDVNQLYFNKKSDVVIKSIINIYTGKEKFSPELLDYTIPKIYLVPIFISYNSKVYLNYNELKDICNKIDTEGEYIYSYQLDPPQENSFNPIGGIRIANITTNNLDIGFKVRREILELINLKKIYRYAKIVCYVILILYLYYTYYTNISFSFLPYQ